MPCIIELADPYGYAPRLLWSLVSDRIHPVGDTGKRSGREALPPLSLPQAVSPASLSPPGLLHPLDSPVGTAHARQSHAVDLTPDERSQPLGPYNDSRL